MDSWGDFLATPPNMTTPRQEMNYLSDLPPLLQPPPFEIPTTYFQSSSFPENDFQVQITPFYKENPVIQPTTVEIENRCLSFSNLDPYTNEKELRDYLGDKDDIRSVDLTNIESRIALVDFYNLKKANSIKILFNKQIYKDRILDVTYAPLKKILDPKNPPNNGTIVVFHIPEQVTEQMIFSIFSKYGEIRQIRGTPSKGFQKFIEFWDVRAAQDALVQMTGKFLMGSRITIEFSLPGGFRKHSVMENNTYSMKKASKNY
ncbi:hypothetical protein TVAG_207000 [Trichomonas vaginalis G3]|uniref:RRM domain-containing protein n=1 Tax=Trichomonas vaginalis (strain ATCC PRA-98 / G3) TaxID=412133 RepID=A2H3A0_TRIV3|nr:RNA binding [Trichomonas vaginalis G3]EAX76117.1 hypothetical protein TVAG_207000 [Trichomonas vaginalis G3]KAI5494831.1 RNA binding [Trichomonas vaginalis G3]|eukprot:XP_001289047.1 hypothetical protein [Trichomonas vaginalis G3]